MLHVSIGLHRFSVPGILLRGRQHEFVLHRTAVAEHKSHLPSFLTSILLGAKSMRPSASVITTCTVLAGRFGSAGFAHYYGLEILELNSLLTSGIGGAIFTALSASASLPPNLAKGEAWKVGQIVKCPHNVTLHVRPDERGNEDHFVINAHVRRFLSPFRP